MLVFENDVGLKSSLFICGGVILLTNHLQRLFSYVGSTTF